MDDQTKLIVWTTVGFIATIGLILLIGHFFPSETKAFNSMEEYLWFIEMTE